VSAPDFHPTDLPSSVALDGDGLRIAAVPFRRANGITSLRVLGVARIPKVQLGSLPSVLHATSVTVTRAPELMPISVSLGQEAIVFSDDVIDEGSSQRASFSVDVFALARREPIPGRYFVSAFGGVLVSNVVVVEIGR